MGMVNRARIANGIVAAVLIAGLSLPAHATRGPTLVQNAADQPITLLKEKSDKESAADAKLPSGCRPVTKNLGDPRPTRNTNCLKPRPILM
jgi:hypothetical protein